jgi:hypothetical protein
MQMKSDWDLRGRIAMLARHGVNVLDEGLDQVPTVLVILDVLGDLTPEEGFRMLQLATHDHNKRGRGIKRTPEEE